MSDSLPENYGQGDSGPADNVGADSTAVESNETSESSVNPYWADALEGIPQEFHPQLTPTFKKWDDNYAKDKAELAKYKPYAEFAEYNVPTEDINNALQLAQLYQSNPRELFDYLRKENGFTVEEAKAAVEEVEEFDLSSQEFNLEKDPRFLQQQQEIATLKQYNQQQDNQRMETQMRTQIDSEVATVTERFPMFDIADVAAMATGLANSRGELPNLVTAAEHMAKMLPQDRASDSAPPTISGNRGIPSNTPNFGKMTSEERSAYVAEHMAAQNKQ